MITRAQFISLLLTATVSAQETQKPKHVFFLVGDGEYKTAETVPAWAKAELEPLGVRCTFVIDNPDSPADFPQLSALKDADALFISIKRRGLPAAQLDLIRKFTTSGKATIGIRTASHAFEPKKPRETEATWATFDRDVFGGHYQLHYGKGAATIATKGANAAAHPILKGIPANSISFPSHLYKCRDLAPTTTVLLNGSIDGKPEISEPLAWLNETKNGTAFYTSLGAPEDFASPAFCKLLVNATLFLVNKPAVSGKK